MKRRPTPITTALLQRWPLPRLDPARGKVARGQIFLLGGSDANPGAVLLAATAGLRVRAGTLVVATSERRVDAMACALPEARVLGLRTVRGELAPAATRAIQRQAAAHGALVLGPGMTDGRAGAALLAYCARARADVTCVVDAAVLCELPERGARASQAWILTPHAGEMASLCGVTPDEVIARPLELAREVAQRYRAVVALKGAVTHVVDSDGRAYQSTCGNLGLGTAGSGDVLAGVIGGLCARGASAVQAAVWGVHLHARCGDALARRIGPLGYLASELLAELPRQLARVSRPRS